MTCYLPQYEVTEVFGFSQEETDRYLEIIRSTAHLIIEFAGKGGVDNASNF